MATRFYLVAALLGLLGLLGFVMPTPLFGVLDVTVASSVVHLAAALITGIAATRGLGTMRSWGQALGYVFAALAAAAFATDTVIAGLLPLTDNNAWFHLALALVFLYHALLAPPTV